MGTSTSVDQLVAKLNKAAVEIKGAEVTGVREAAVATKGIFEEGLPAKRLSGVGKKGARLSAFYTIKGNTAVVAYRGPVHLLNNDTKAHLIEPKGNTRTKSGRKRSGAKALAIGGGAFANAEHPGTTGKKFHQGSVRKARVVAPKVMADGQRRAVQRAF